MLDWTRLTPSVQRAVSIAASKFPSHHDTNDIEQSVWVWVLENKNTVTRILTEEDGPNRLDSHLIKVANGAYKKEDAAVYGYQPEDKFFYSVDLIKSVLEVIFNYEDWQSFAMSQDSQPRAKKNPAHGGDNLASYADVKSAVEKLPEDYYNLIVWRYKYSYTFAQIGAETGRDASSVRQRLERALKAIQALLGEQPLSDLRGGYDGRTADAVTRGSVSRSDTAQHIVERDYSG
ncbi:MAG TPA: sigma-70 family RNA polymerase sigma factor [Candidatus Paceibacterota bacterium]